MFKVLIGSYSSAPPLDFAWMVPPVLEPQILVIMKQDLFFHKYAEDKEGNPLNSVICKTECISREKLSFNGKTAHCRTQGTAQFCLLIITDDDGATVNPRQYGFKPDQVLSGIRDSGSPVLDQDTGEPTGLNWAEPYIKTQSED